MYGRDVWERNVGVRGGGNCKEEEKRKDKEEKKRQVEVEVVGKVESGGDRQDPVLVPQAAVASSL